MSKTHGSIVFSTCISPYEYTVKKGYTLQTYLSFSNITYITIMTYGHFFLIQKKYKGVVNCGPLEGCTKFTFGFSNEKKFF